MKTKVIKSVIARKMKAWWESIEDVALRERVAKGTIVTGGCIASMLLGEKVNDFDVYFRTRQLAYDVACYYLARFKPKKSAGIACKMYVEQTDDRVMVVVKSAGVASEEGSSTPYQYFESAADGAAGDYLDSVMGSPGDQATITDPGDIEDTYEELKEAATEVESIDKPLEYRPVFISTNAIMLSDRVQCVLRFSGEPDAIHENYDFVHCTNYWTSWDSQLVLHSAALETLLTKELRYVGSKYPVCSLFRVRKFLSRGWTINAGQMLKMVMQVSALDLTNLRVMRDQLTGVDVAYFMEVVDKLAAKDPEKVDTAYLVEIIDRMFG